MTLSLVLGQALNGLQFGLLLFLMAAGLTLVFGIMSFVNLAHGSLYMFGAYFAAGLWIRRHAGTGTHGAVTASGGFEPTLLVRPGAADGRSPNQPQTSRNLKGFAVGFCPG